MRVAGDSNWGGINVRPWCATKRGGQSERLWGGRAKGRQESANKRFSALWPFHASEAPQNRAYSDARGRTLSVVVVVRHVEASEAYRRLKIAWPSPPCLFQSRHVPAPPFRFAFLLYSRPLPTQSNEISFYSTPYILEISFLRPNSSIRARKRPWKVHTCPSGKGRQPLTFNSDFSHFHSDTHSEQVNQFR